MKALIILIVLAAYSIPANAIDFTIGAQAGQCKTSVYLRMCSESRAVWHVYAQADQQVADFGQYGTLHAVGGVDHFSSFDGSADLRGDEANQSGAFDYVGAGIEWRF